VVTCACVCRAADQDENAAVSCVPRAHPGDDEGVLLLAGLALDVFPSTRCDESLCAVVHSCVVDNEQEG
jgi:hypothetical protein